jgi:hypothetical protein
MIGRFQLSRGTFVSFTNGCLTCLADEPDGEDLLAELARGCAVSAALDWSG